MVDKKQFDADIDREVMDALGGESMFDILDVEDKRSGGSSKTVTGKIIAVHGDDVFVDIGSKSQGLLPGVQFTESPPEVGNEVEVVIERHDVSEGLIMLSLPGATKEASWDTLDVGQTVEGMVTGHNKGGLELLINGIRAFMPISQIEMFQVDDLHPYVNQKLTCQVVEFNESAGNLVVSRRYILEREAEEAKAKLLERLTEGQIVEGVVRNIVPYGAFVDIGGIDGLLHIGDMAHRRIKEPTEVIKLGQTLKVMILKFDRDNQKLSLGLKQVMPDPWEGAESKFEVNSIVTGRVSHLADFGAFVEIEEGIDGLVPIGEITYKQRIRVPGDVLKEGQIVKVKVLQVDVPRKRISLSIKQAASEEQIEPDESSEQTARKAKKRKKPLKGGLG